MNSSLRLFRFTACLFALGICLSVSGPLAPAQSIPPAQAPRRVLERERLNAGRLNAERLLRLMELPAVRKALALTDEQRDKMEDISFNVRRTSIRQQAAVRVQRLELERMMRSETPDRSAIDKKVQEIAQAQTAILQARVNALMDLRGILTKEQRQKIRESVLQRIQQAARAKIQQARPGPKTAPTTPPAPKTPVPFAPNPPASR